MKDQIHKILEVASDSDKAELQIMNNARIQNLESYQKQPNAANGKDYEVASSNLEKTVSKLFSKYFEKEPHFESRKALLDYLVKNKYKISKGKLYGDAKKNPNEAGYLKVESDGSIRQSSVDKWLNDQSGGGKAKQLSVAATAATEDEIGELGLDKLRSEVGLSKEKLRKAELENRKEDKKWILVSKAFLFIAGLFGELKAELTHGFTVNSDRLRLLAKTASAEEFDAEIKATIVGAFNALADSGKIEVIFKSDDEDEEDGDYDYE